MAITRRNLLASAAAGATLGLTAFPKLALASEKLTGVFYIPQSYKALSAGANGFIEQLKTAGGDTLAVDYYDSGTLLKADEQLSALRAGSIDFMFHTTSYITRSVPILGITGLPSVVEALYENPGRIARGSPLFDLMNEELAKEGLYMPSMMGNILEPEYIWSTKANPIRSVADVSGRKVRVVSFEATQVMEGWGAASVRIPSSELYLALQRGTVDAAVANISTILGRSLQEQSGTVYKLPMTAFGIGLFVDRNRFDAMSAEAQAAIQTAAEWLDQNGAALANNDLYPSEFWPKIAEAGIEVIEPTAEDIAKLDEAAKAVDEAWVAEVGEDIGRRAIALALGQNA